MRLMLSGLTSGPPLVSKVSADAFVKVVGAQWTLLTGHACWTLTRCTAQICASTSARVVESTQFRACPVSLSADVSVRCGSASCVATPRISRIISAGEEHRDAGEQQAIANRKTAGKVLAARSVDSVVGTAWRLLPDG